MNVPQYFKFKGYTLKIMPKFVNYGWTGRDVQPPSISNALLTILTQRVSKTLVFLLLDSFLRSHEQTDGRTKGRAKPLLELRVHNQKGKKEKKLKTLFLSEPRF